MRLKQVLSGMMAVHWGGDNEKIEIGASGLRSSSNVTRFAAENAEVCDCTSD